MLRYKAELAGIVVRDDIDERGTSRTCHVCGKVREANRINRGSYRCQCGWTAQADVNGALNIYERAFQVSPIKGSSGRVARPVVLSFHPGWHTVHEPELCVGILRRVAQEDMDAVTNSEVLQEILYRYSAIGQTEQSLRLARLVVDQVGRLILPVTLADVERALYLIDRYRDRIKTRDAIYAATMLNNGLTHIISAYTHFEEIKEVVRVDPRDVVA